MSDRGERRTRLALVVASVVVLVILAVAVAGALAAQGMLAERGRDMTTPSPSGERARVPLQVTGVRVEVGDRGAVVLRVTGIVPDACTRPLPPEIRRRGQRMEVAILGERPREAVCAQVASEYDQTIALGVLEPGEYRVAVNGFETDVRVGVGDKAPPGGDLLVRPVTVTGVDVRVAESFPPQGFADVTGWLADGCTEALEPTVQRQGTTVTVTILSQRPRDAVCTMATRPYRETVALGTLEPGREYTLRVNDYQTVFSVP